MAMSARVRKNSNIPITIGCADPASVRLFAPLVDVISFQAFVADEKQLNWLCEEHLTLATKLEKPVICSAACLGSLDDRIRGEIAKLTIDTLEKYDIGWLAWHLVAGAIVGGSRWNPSHRGTKPDDGFMPFVLDNGATRPNHEALVKKGTDKMGNSTVAVIRPPFLTDLEDTQAQDVSPDTIKIKDRLPKKAAEESEDAKDKARRARALGPTDTLRRGSIGPTGTWSRKEIEVRETTKQDAGSDSGDKATEQA